MEIRHVSAVLFARDFRRLAGFYSEVVGLALSKQRDDHTVLNRLGFDLVVHQIPARFLADTTTAPPRRREEAAIKLSFPVDDLERVRRTTATLGGVFESSRARVDGRKRADVHGPGSRRERVPGHGSCLALRGCSPVLHQVIPPRSKRRASAAERPWPRLPVRGVENRALRRSRLRRRCRPRLIRTTANNLPSNKSYSERSVANAAAAAIGTPAGPIYWIVSTPLTGRARPGSPAG